MIGNTADSTVIQKTAVDTHDKKGPQKVTPWVPICVKLKPYFQKVHNTAPAVIENTLFAEVYSSPFIPHTTSLATPEFSRGVTNGHSQS